MKTKIKSVKIVCDECLGARFVSSCCGEPMEYDGTYDLRVGDTVTIYISVWSDDYLKDYFNYYPKLDRNFSSNIKVFYGKVVEIVNEYTVKVKIKYSRKKEPLLANIDDIDIDR